MIWNFPAKVVSLEPVHNTIAKVGGKANQNDPHMLGRATGIGQLGRVVGIVWRAPHSYLEFAKPPLDVSRDKGSPYLAQAGTSPGGGAETGY